jgi:protein-disulfide isomerase
MSLKPMVSDKDHIQGNQHAAIELVEYGDYQCPHCGQAYPIIKAIQQKFGSNLKFVFRNFPLSKVHPQAKIAAVAAEAANKQGRFWEMHDIIFENQKNLFARSLLEYARRIHLNIDLFEQDLKSDVLVKKVEDDFESGLRSGVSGTPGFFINGKKYNGGSDEDSLTDYIVAKIAWLRENEIPFL